MHDSFEMINDINEILNENIEIYGKLVGFVRKFTPYMTGIMLDSNFSKSGFSTLAGDGMTTITTIHARSFGCEMINSLGNDQTSMQENEIYPIVFSYPKLNKEYAEKHMKNLTNYLNTDVDQKVKFFYDQVRVLFQFSSHVPVTL